MPDQDAAENKAIAAAEAISEQVGRLYMEAYADGFRNGMEGAALTCQAFADEAANNYELDSAVRDFLVLATHTLRDQVRLVALQLPEAGETTNTVSTDV